MATPDEQLATMIANMPEKTGKPLEDWLSLVSASGLSKHGEIVKMLKTDHGVGHGFANLIAHKALGGGEASQDDLVEAQYAGPKAGLRPIFEAVQAFVAQLGDDVEIAPKKTCVSFRSSKQFALAQPTTKTRIDLGIALKGKDEEGRLESWSGMTSHRVKLESLDDFDEQTKQWVREAYDQSK